MENNKAKAVILAAGKGTRMKSEKPKVLHKIFEKELLGYVLDAAFGVKNLEKSYVIVGHQAERVEEYIKSNYSNANVYFSIDHDWNDNCGNNERFFNGRDFLYRFNEYAKRGGNYNWSLAIHPYPNPLPNVRFWRSRPDKSEKASVVTPMNLSAVTDVLTKEDFLNPDGDVREISVTVMVAFLDAKKPK